MAARTPKVAAGAAAIAAAAFWVRKVVMPKRPADAALPIPWRIPDPDARPSPDGAGVRIVVNPSSGPAWTSSPADALREALPGAEVIELAEGDDLEELLEGDDLVAIGAAGGDGTLSSVARIAADRGVPLVAIPAGTLNHLARDLGLEGVDDAAAAVRAGTVAHMDLGVVADRCFVNTLSFGGYTAVVDTRERWEGRIGKWPALLLALAVELRRMEPLCLDIDDRRQRVWVAWIGNGRYDPLGFAPSWRERLDDGVLDIRIVNGAQRFSRSRLLAHVLAGRLSTCPVYEERTATSVRIRTADGEPLRMANDGETFDAPADLEVTKRPRALMVAVPPGATDQR